MLTTLGPTFTRRCLPLVAAALAGLLTASCGADDDNAPSQAQRPSTTAAATSPAPASAPSSSTPAADATPISKNCPVTAQELSQRVGLKLRAIPSVFHTKSACSFGPAGDCPCGSTKYAGVLISIAVGFPLSTAVQRTIVSKNVDVVGGLKLIDRPDLGDGAFVTRDDVTRDSAGRFPSSAGAVFVSVGLGPRDATNRAHAAQDARVADRVISFVRRQVK